jgi:hypothetical protein
VLVESLKDKYFRGQDSNNTMLKVTCSFHIPKPQADQRVRDFDQRDLKKSRPPIIRNNNDLRDNFRKRS